LIILLSTTSSYSVQVVDCSSVLPYKQKVRGSSPRPPTTQVVYVQHSAIFHGRLNCHFCVKTVLKIGSFGPCAKTPFVRRV
jgi:hypothetical protein